MNRKTLYQQKLIPLACMLALLFLGGGLSQPACAFVFDGAGQAIDISVQNSGSVAPAGVVDHIVPAQLQSAKMISNVPTSTWTYGCSATSAGMIFGYYDRTGYSNMYTGPCNGGVAPLSDLGQGDNPSAPISGACSIIATQMGFDGRGTYGHVDDYWTGYGNTGPDPWEGVRAEHTWGQCTADYMGTNQWKWDFRQTGSTTSNKDGATTYFSYTSSGKLYDYIPNPARGLPQTELCHGMRLFAESRGYTVLENYTQKADSVVTGGFSLADYQAEIDAGYPLLIHVTGHSMVGVGYEPGTSTIYIHDTWGNYVAQMEWGGDYSGMDLRAVTAVHLAAVPEPATLVMLAIGAIFLVGIKLIDKVG